MFDWSSIIVMLASTTLSAVLAWWAATRTTREKAESDKAEALRVLTAEKAAAMLALTNKVTELEKAQAVVNASVIPMASMYQEYLRSTLVHMHEPRTDELMIKAKDHSLTPEEEDELEKLITKRITDMSAEIDDKERRSAQIYMAVMRQSRDFITAMKSEAVAGIPPRLQWVYIPQQKEE